MKLFLLVKNRGAPQTEWKIHSRIKRGWRHWRKRADNLRKQLGSKFVVKLLCPYIRTNKNGKPFFLPLETLENEFFNRFLPSKPRNNLLNHANGLILSA